MLASAGSDCTVRFWKLNSGRQITAFKAHSAPVNSLAFNADGQLLATASNDGTVRLWHIDQGKLIAILKGHEGRVWSVASVPSSDGIPRWVSAGWDGTLRLWEYQPVDA
jgi:WD40 repeat protein